MSTQGTVEERLVSLEQLLAAGGPLQQAVRELQARPPGGSITTNTLALNEEGKIEASLSEMPAVVRASAQSWVNVENHGALAGDDGTEAIVKATEVAKELAGETYGTWGLFFPRKYVISATSRIGDGIPWLFAPKEGGLEQAAGFEYTDPEKQYAIINEHFGAGFTANADVIQLINGIFTLQGGSAKGGIGFANIASLLVQDTIGKTTGAGEIVSVFDLYASYRRATLRRVLAINSTEAAHGGAIWLRNKNPEGGEGATAEGLVLEDCIARGSTGDEALAVWSGGSLLRDVRIRGGLVEALASSQNHNVLCSAFALSNNGEFTHAGLEGVRFEGLTFRDLHNTLAEGGVMLRSGQTGDENQIVQDILDIGCTYQGSTNQAKCQVRRHTANKYEGSSDGVASVQPYINTTGSPTNFQYALHSLTSVVDRTVIGTFTEKQTAGCKQVIPGAVPNDLWLPESIPTYKNAASNEKENRPALGESFDRSAATGTLALVTGDLYLAGIKMRGNIELSGVGFAVEAAEGTPADRTHLYIVIVNASGEVVAVSEDFTSATDTPLASETLAGLLAIAPYKTPEEGRYYAGVLNATSAGNPLTLRGLSGKGYLSHATPPVSALVTGLSGPPALGSPLALSAVSFAPWLCFH